MGDLRYDICATLNIDIALTSSLFCPPLVNITGDSSTV